MRGPRAVSAHIPDLRVVDGDDVEVAGQYYRLAGYDTPELVKSRSTINPLLERRRGAQAKLRLQNLLDNAKAVHIIPWEKTVAPGNRELAVLLVNGWDVATIAQREYWGVHYKERGKIDWGDPSLPFADHLPAPSPTEFGGAAPGEWEVTDGDTVKRLDGLGGMEEFRLLDLDAPEILKARNALERQRGELAKARLDWLLANARQIKISPRAASNGNLTHRGRRFADLFIDGQSVSDIAKREGWGAPYREGEQHPWHQTNCPFRVPA